MSAYFPVIAKLLLGSVMLVIYARLGGRSQVNPLSGTEVVSGMVVGAMISGALFNDAVSVWAVGAVIALWTVLFILMRKMKKSSIRAEKLIDGESVQLVREGRPLQDGFEKLNLSLTDFTMKMHQAGVKRVCELHEVWQDTNGEFTIVRQGEAPPAILVVERGKVHMRGLKRLGRDKAWLEKEIKDQNASLENVFMAEYHNGKLDIYY